MKEVTRHNYKNNAQQIGGLLLAALLASTPFARAEETKPVSTPEKPATVVEKAPNNWLAFLSYQGGFTPIEYHALNQTPYIMLFQDGRLFWRDDNIKYDAPNRSREMWREAELSPAAFQDFKAKAREIEFLTIQKPEEVAPNPHENGMIALRPQICDAATTVIGLQERVPSKTKNAIYKQRMISEYALGAFSDEGKDNRYIQSLLQMQKMLQELRPKESKRYEPKSIRVTFMNSNTRGTVVVEPEKIVPVWPLADTPNVDDANIYSGADEKKLVEILTENPLVKIGDAVYTAIWAPAIAVPKNLPKPVAAAEISK